MIRSMKSLGIIAEFNPFHQGHEYLIKTAMADTGADVCIAAISGDFVQRGAPAAFDKWTRAEAAVKQGVNLVVELPVVFACNSAEYFAKGGVDVLEGFGCIDYIAFGSEHGDIGELQKAAHFLEEKDDVIKEKIQILMKEGLSHPRARAEAVKQLARGFDESLITSPNNILAVEYLKHLKRMEPYTVKRKGQGYHQSATEIRRELSAREPEKFRKMDETYWKLVASKILQTDSGRLEEIFSAGEGLGNKLKNEIRYASSAQELIERVKSKAYTHTRISRLLTQVLLDIDEEAVSQGGGYIRILGFDSKGAKFMKEVKKKECAAVPLITNINKELKNHPEIREKLEKDVLAADIYNLITDKNLYDNSDFVRRPYMCL